MQIEALEISNYRLFREARLVKQNGFTTARKASENETLRKLVEEGDLPGALWKQGLFEGAGPRSKTEGDFTSWQ